MCINLDAAFAATVDPKSIIHGNINFEQRNSAFVNIVDVLRPNK